MVSPSVTFCEHAVLGSRIGAVFVGRIPNLSLRNVGRGEHETWGADHSRSCGGNGLNICTVESPANGDHCNENAWLGQYLGDFPCAFAIDSVSCRTWLFLARLDVDEIS